MKNHIKKIKFVFVVLVSLLISIESFALIESSSKIVVKNIVMEAVELSVDSNLAIDLNESEYPYFEDRGAEITGRDLDRVLISAYNSK